MKNVQKCGKFNGDYYDDAGRLRIINDIINAASSDVDQELVDGLNRVMIRPENETINAEHDRLRAMNISSFQFHDNFNRTAAMTQSYQFENSMISAGMRSQGSDSFTCWAFSCATMLRTSTKLFIRRCHEIGLISQTKMNKLLAYINEEKVHVELRNLIMMILLPKKLHIDDQSQAAFLRAAVSRIVNPTVMEPRGLDFLRPIWSMMQTETLDKNGDTVQNTKYIGLAPDQVRVQYTKYINDFKPQLTPLQPGQISIRDAVNDKLTPVGGVDFKGSQHAMVLDTINVNDELIFKNTHTNNKKHTLAASDPAAPDEFYFIHIEPLNNQIRRASTAQASEHTESHQSVLSIEEPANRETGCWDKFCSWFTNCSR